MSLFEEIAEKQLELQEMIKKQGQGALKEYFTEFFENNPTIHAVRWVQFTPHFNDGEPCVFGIHEPEIKLTKDADKEDEEYANSYSYGDSELWYSEWNLWSYPNPLPEGWHEMSWTEQRELRITFPEAPAYKKLNRDMQANEKVFDMIFGDGYQITATRDGFEVEEHYHD